jgi:hypothetical protein
VIQIQDELEVVVSMFLGHPCVSQEMIASALLGTVLTLFACGEGDDSAAVAADKIIKSIQLAMERGDFRQPTAEEKANARARLADAYQNRVQALQEPHVVGVFLRGGGKIPPEKLN